MAYSGPFFGSAGIICYKNPFNPSMLKHFMKFTQSYALKQNKSTRIQLSHCQGFIFILLTAGELVLLSLCIQCLTEFLRIRPVSKL